ncbi:MAG: 50S ribosomal protein L18, partial [bacterium]
STLDPNLRKQLKHGGNAEAAGAIGKLLAQRAKDAGIERVALDRSGFRYHGRIKAFAEAAREGGLQF